MSRRLQPVTKVHDASKSLLAQLQTRVELDKQIAAQEAETNAAASLVEAAKKEVADLFEKQAASLRGSASECPTRLPEVEPHESCLFECLLQTLPQERIAESCHQ